MADNFDFSGYVTKYDILCSDGRIIAKNAFDECDNKVVPLTYNFYHNDMSFALGNVTLECRYDGVYGYCKFNDTPGGKIYRRLVKEHIFKYLGIYANEVKIDKDKIVTYGVIREVALVEHGANPGAYIDYYADNYWEEKSKYLTPPPTPARCPDCSNEIRKGTFVSEPIEIVKAGEPLSNSDVIRAATEKGELYRRGFKDAMKRYKRSVGEWIFHEDNHESNRYGCNQCGNLNNTPGNFCPNCGAYMKKRSLGDLWGIKNDK